MKKITSLAAAALIAAVCAGSAKAGNFESQLQYVKNSVPAPAAAGQASVREEKLSGLGTLSLKMVSVKAKLERVNLSLWDITRILENKEGGSLNNSLSGLMGDLKKCTAAAKALDAAAAGAIAKTPKTPDTVAVAKLLLADIAEYTDNDETIAMIRLEEIITKYPEYKDAVQPQIEEYTKTIAALGNAGDKVMKLSGPLEAE